MSLDRIVRELEARSDVRITKLTFDLMSLVVSILAIYAWATGSFVVLCIAVLLTTFKLRFTIRT